MTALLELRHTSSRPTHYEELRQLLCLTAVETLQWALSWTPSPDSAGDGSGSGGNEAVFHLPRLTTEVETFLSRMVNSVKSEPEMWDVAALYHEIIGSGGEQGLPDAVKASLHGGSGSGSGDGETSAMKMLKGRSALALKDCRTKQVQYVSTYSRTTLNLDLS
jgi:hypothetical protein